MKYSKEEIANLKTLLNHDDVTNVELGLEMLNGDADLINACYLELFVIHWFNRGPRKLRDRVNDVLMVVYEEEAMLRNLELMEQLKIFTINSGTEVPVNFQKFKEIASEIWAIFKKADFYSENIERTANSLAFGAWFQEATYFFEKNIEFYPTKASVYHDYGSFLLHYYDDLQPWKSKEILSKSIVDTFERSLELDPNNYFWYFDLAMHYHYQVKDLEAASETYRKVIKRDPQNHQAMHMLGVLYHLNGSIVEGKYWYLETLKLFPLRLNTMNNLAWLLAKEEGDFETALPYAEKAVRMDKKSAENLNTKAYVLWKGFKQAKLAEELYLEAHKLHKKQVAENEEGKKRNKYEWAYGGLTSAGGADTCIRLASLGIELREDYAGAKKWLKRGVRLDAEDPKPLEALGDLMFNHFEDEKSALYYYEKQLKLEPENKDLKDKIKKCFPKKK